MKFGAHMSTSGGAWKALERGRSIGCEVVQIFVKNNMRWFGSPPSPADAARFRKEAATLDFSCVFGHTGYLINLGAPPSPNRDKSLESLVQEIEFALSVQFAPFRVRNNVVSLSWDGPMPADLSGIESFPRLRRIPFGRSCCCKIA